MPIIKVSLIEGYDDETRLRLGQRLTDAVRSVIAAPVDGVTIAIEEVKRSNYMRGRRAKAPGEKLPDPVTLIRDFLQAMEARDLARAKGFLDDAFHMTFPGGSRFEALEDLVAWSKTRYRRVAKTYEGFDVAPGPDGVVVVCFGTLSGEWNDGEAFSGIRFIDRFVVRDGRIIEQRVWNDMGEYGPRRAQQNRA